MTMLDVFEEVRKTLPFELEVLNVKEDNSKYHLTVRYEGVSTKVELRKTVTPGAQEEYCWYAIATAMSSIHLDRGDMARTRLWLDALHDRSVIYPGNF